MICGFQVQVLPVVAKTSTNCLTPNRLLKTDLLSIMFARLRVSYLWARQCKGGSKRTRERIVGVVYRIYIGSACGYTCDWWPQKWRGCAVRGWCIPNTGHCLRQQSDLIKDQQRTWSSLQVLTERGIDINRYNVSLRTTRAKHLLRLRALAMVYSAKSMQQSPGNWVVPHCICKKSALSKPCHDSVKRAL